MLCICTNATGQPQLNIASVRSGSGIETPSLPLSTDLPSRIPAGADVFRSIADQHFQCNTGFTEKQCQEEVAILEKALASYPLPQLGSWTWILVRSEDWKPILLPRGLDPDSPAFTFSAKRQTFIEDALVAPGSARARELLLKWHMKISDLLDLAIRHELGHAVCQNSTEQSAELVARLLQQKKPISCVASSKK